MQTGFFDIVTRSVGACYRGAFLLSGGYRRARRERLAHVRPGLREEGNELLAGKEARGGHAGAKPRALAISLTSPTRFAVSRRVRRVVASVPL